jgi:hypothetical protein
MPIDTGGNKMPEYTKEIYEQKTDFLDKAFMGYLIGTGTILTTWFFGCLYFVILN